MQTEKALHNCGKEINPKGWDLLSFCQLFPPCIQKAVPYLSRCWRLKAEKTLSDFTENARNSVQ